MGIFSKFRESVLGTKSSDNVTSSLDLFKMIYGTRESSSGTSITPETALEVSTYLACVRVLSNGVCQVPSRLMIDENDSPVQVKDHPLSVLFRRKPNKFMTTFEFWEVIMFHLAVAWNAYIFINRVGSERKIVELLPIPVGNVIKEVDKDNVVTYKVRSPRGNGEKIYPEEAIWHIKGPSWDGIVGMDALKLMRNAIGLSSSLENNQADFQRNGAKMSGLYSVAEKLGKDRYKDLRDWFEQEFNGPGKGYRPMILDSGAKFTPFTMTGVDQQLIETRKFEIEEICRGHGVMPIMIGHADKTATYASAEQMFLAHVVHTLSPWYRRLEVSVEANLLTEEEIRRGMYYKFFPNALMRGAAKDRAEFFQKALGSGSAKGWMTQNEVRKLEELPKIDDEEADKLPQPSSSAPEETEEPEEDESGETGEEDE